MVEKLYVDPDFPPMFQSISRPGINNFSKDNIDSLKNCRWKRPSKLLNASKFTLFGDDPSNNDIQQGILGDCYFLCACAALAEFPKIIRNIFKQEELSEDGSYTLKVYYEGSIKSLKIDDLIPCNSNGVTYFAHFANNKLWVALLEKAWAKVNICYENCCTGYFDEAIQFLTGAPSRFIDNSRTSTEDLYTQIYEAYDNNQVMGCLVSLHRNNANFKLTGLVEGHLYSLIAAYTLNTNKGEARLLKVRNPWGYQEWTGDWSRNSDLWTKELKEIVEFEKAEDGAFYIKMEDYKANFSETYISSLNDTYFHCSKIFNSKYKTFSCISLYIYKGTEGFISVNQNPIRRMSLLKSIYIPGFIGFMLFRIDEDNKTFVFISEQSGNDNMVSLKLPSNLLEGNYIVLGKSYYHYVAATDTYFTSYTSCQLKMEDYISNDSNFLEKLMIIAAKKNGKKTSPPNHPEIEIYNTCAPTNSNFGCYTFINDSSNRPIKVTCSVKLKGMIELNNKPLNNLEIYINPKQSRCFIFVRTEYFYNYEANYNCTFLPKISNLSSLINPQKPELNLQDNAQNSNLNSEHPPIYPNINEFNKLNNPLPNSNPIQINFPQSQINNKFQTNTNSAIENNTLGNLYIKENENEQYQNSEKNSIASSWNNEEMAIRIISEGGINNQFTKDPCNQLIIDKLLLDNFIDFVFMNDSSKKLQLKIKFSIMIGVILENAEKNQRWSITLQQGEKCIKRMRILHPNYTYNSKFKYQFN